MYDWSNNDTLQVNNSKKADTERNDNKVTEENDFNIEEKYVSEEQQDMYQFQKSSMVMRYPQPVHQATVLKDICISVSFK